MPWTKISEKLPPYGEKVWMRTPKRNAKWTPEHYSYFPEPDVVQVCKKEDQNEGAFWVHILGWDDKCKMSHDSEWQPVKEPEE